jgi:LEA14-like dessication related protein
MGFHPAYKLILFFVIVSLCSCTEYKEIRVSSIKDFKVTKLGVEGIEAEVAVEIDNPNSLGFNVYRSKARLSYGGIDLGEAKIKRRVHIGPKSSEEHRFKLKGTLKNVSLTDLSSLLSGKKKVELKGDLKVGRFLYRRRFPIDLKQVMSLTR